MSLRTLIFIIITVCSISTWAEDVIYNDISDATVDDKTKIINLYGDVTLTPTKIIRYDKPRIVAIAIYPQLQSSNENNGVYDFNELANDFVEQQIKEFKTRVHENLISQKDMAKSDIKNDLRIDFDSSLIKSGRNHIISVRFSVQGYIAGMPRAYHFHSSLNYDLDHTQAVILSDLFAADVNYLDLLASYSNNILNRRLLDKQMITNGTLPTADNFQVWNIKPNGLLFTFDESKVAPYVHGAQTVLIPFSVLEPMFTSRSPIARCVKYKKTCRSNNVLTGGFIDEAALPRSNIRFAQLAMAKP